MSCITCVLYHPLMPHHRRCCAARPARARFVHVPELSALLEEDEEGDEARGTCSGDEEAESEGVAMELTGNTMHTPGAAAGAAGAATPAGGAPAAGQDETPRLASEWGPDTRAVGMRGAAGKIPLQAWFGTEWGWRRVGLVGS